MNLITENELKELLVDGGFIPEEKFKASLDEAHESKKDVSTLITELGLISEINLAQLIADKLELPYINLREIAIPKEIIELIPFKVLKEQQIIPFRQDKKGIYIAMANPLDRELIDFLKKKFKIPILIYYAYERIF